MNQLPPCQQTCPSPCSAAPADQEPPSLSQLLARFEREAVRGVCDVGRYRMNYSVWGAGPPLVFVHGVADVSRSFLAPIARLSAHFRCIAYDLPGTPGDKARLGRYRHEDLVSDLLALLDHLKVERAYVYGASFGAAVTLRALRAAPARLPRAILQAGTAHRPLRRAEFWLSWLGRWLPGATGRIPKREKILEAVHKQTFASQPEEVWRAFVDWTGSVPVATLAHQARWLHRLDLRADLAQVTQPVLLVWGDQDRVMPLRYAETLRAGLPSAGLAVIEGAGHVPHYTHPDALAQVVRQFLTPPGAASCPGPQACGLTLSCAPHDCEGHGHTAHGG